MTRYQTDPVGYARDVLGLAPWGVQEEIAHAVLEPPYRVAVQSGHNTGKSWTGGWLINWFYDCFDPGAVITTAPTATHVCDVLWKEVRLQRGARGGFTGPARPELRSSPDHYAKGFTTGKSEAFHGRHDSRMLFLIDESVGVDPIFFEVIKSMFKPELGHAWVMFFNPTDTTSAAYAEVKSGNWRVIRMSSLDHPNIAAQLAGRSAPIPSAVSLSQIQAALDEDCDPVEPGEPRQDDDFEFPPGSGVWFRPGPVFQARWLGQWPSQGTFGVWSESLWRLASTLELDIPANAKPEIGCDVARFGDDWTAMHVRIGPVSVHHEAHNGWDTVRTAARLKELCHVWGPDHNCLPEKVVVRIDDDGVGGGVVDQRGPYNFLPINAASLPLRLDDYPNARSELWFHAASLARRRLLSVARLPRDVRQRLETQLMAPAWALDSMGRRVVEPKDVTKEKIRRSPDDADAFNLAFYPVQTGVMRTVEAGKPPERPTMQQRAQGRTTGHGFGRGRK